MEEKKNTILVDGVEKTFHIEKRSIINVKIGVRPGFILRKVGDAFMVMPTGPRMKEYKGMITLNDTGAVLFKASQQPNPTVRSLMDALKAEYGVEDQEAETAVRSFVQQCARAGLFEMETKEIEVQVIDEEKTEEKTDGNE